MRERDIIDNFFKLSFDNTNAINIKIGIGDDAAAVFPPVGEHLLISTDTLVENIHFFSDVNAYALGIKSAAVSLSDIAAMGARALWMTVSLSRPPVASDWFRDFAQGLSDSTKQYNYAIIGGDLTRANAITITTTVMGAMQGTPLQRSGAKLGDDIWVSGYIGAAAYAVGTRLKNYAANINAVAMKQAIKSLETPIPRLALGQALVDLAHTAMDISDGLLTTAQAIADASACCLSIDTCAIPLPPCLENAPQVIRHNCTLAGGDDYELFFTAPIHHRQAITALASNAVPLTRIGSVQEGTGVLLWENEQLVSMEQSGYEHNFNSDHVT